MSILIVTSVIILVTVADSEKWIVELIHIFRIHTGVIFFRKERQIINKWMEDGC